MSATLERSTATDRYEMVVGLEVHVQLKTRTKAFCNCSTNFGDAPNVNTCPVCLALPGALPVLNYEAVRLATRAALALGCTVRERSIFARKNYFYPDLPKGYQISQYDKPLAEDGHLVIGTNADGSPITVGITRVHLEEDAGKSIHDRYPGLTAIDLNRSGVPLIEIVSEPDMRSAREAGAYLRALKQIIEYTGVSDANMEEGSLRVDANISIREHGETKLGTKTEVKNMNSFSGVERALEAEFNRQVAIIESGGKVEQQTMLWDAARGEVRPARSKEQSHDYRYFPEPDLPPLVLSKEWIEKQRKALPSFRASAASGSVASTACLTGTSKCSPPACSWRTTSRASPGSMAIPSPQQTGSWARCSPRSRPPRRRSLSSASGPPISLSSSTWFATVSSATRRPSACSPRWCRPATVRSRSPSG
jgi:aspartyl-tRNA(Asn)/glutamyl-tRNA(Gln) amidotransferase subunit B